MRMRHEIEERRWGSRTAARRRSLAPWPATIGLLAGLSMIVFVSGAAAETSREPVAPMVPAALADTGDLALLLEVPDLTPSRVEQTDASLASAARDGSRPELEKKSGFRKRNIDLFRTEQDIEILRQDMQLRFRVRAKTRETMSVELRF